MSSNGDRRQSTVLALALLLVAACGGPARQAGSSAPSPSFEEAAAGRAALTVYEASQELAHRAFSDPAQDWTGELEQVAADPYRSALLADLERADRDDPAAYASDLTTTDPTVTDVDLAAGIITLTDCSNGAAVTAEVHRAGDGRWLVTEHTQNPDQPC